VVRSSAASDVYKRQGEDGSHEGEAIATWAEQWLRKTE
jgi:hypothetical protein